MKETLTAIAATLFFLVTIGGVDPNMTIGEFVRLYSPQIPVEQEAAVEQPAAPALEINNEIPKPAEPELVIVIDDPAPTVEPAVSAVELVTPTVELTVATPESVVPMVTVTTGEDERLLASIIKPEANGLPHEEKTGVGLCALNRKRDWGLTLQEVINSGAFKVSQNYDESDLEAARAALRQSAGVEPRVLPEGYYYFNGDGRTNYFRKSPSARERYSVTKGFI